MNRMFEIDFRKATRPVGQTDGFPYRCRLQPQEAEQSPRKGIRFPLKGGGLAFESRHIISDAAGSLELEFEMAAPPTESWPLVQAFGQYDPFVAVRPNELRVQIYHHAVRMLLVWKPGTVYRLRLSWDHSSGVAVDLNAGGGPAVRVVQRLHWRAFGQKYLPFAIGGMVAGRPLYSAWTGTFAGWIRGVRMWPEPIEAPSPGPSISSSSAPCGGALRHRDVAVLDLSDPPIRDSRWRRDTIPDRLAALRRTREAAGLDSVIAGCRDELVLFCRLTWHVSRLWPHSHYWPWPKGEQRHIFWKRGDEMIPRIKAGEMGGMCGGYAHVMEEVFWSLGFDARRIQVEGHSSFEAYSNAFDKWIICDASYNRQCHIFLGRDGTPLGAGDLILLHERRLNDPAAFDGVRAAVCQEDGSVRPVESAWHEPYRFLGVGLGDPNRNQGSRPHVWYVSRHDRLLFPGGMNVAGQSVLTEKTADLCWSCQRVRVALAWEVPGRRLKVTAKPFQATWFDRVEQQVDEGHWVKAGRTLFWDLHGGVNTLALRTRNKLGATGHPWRLRLWRRP